jgi:hypothetical protein
MLEMKNIGKPYAGEPLVRFDEGRLHNLMISLSYLVMLPSTLFAFYLCR